MGKIFCSIFLSIILLSCTKNGRDIEQVKNLDLQGYKDITYGQLLEKQPGFNNYKWNEYNNVKGNPVVEFNGYFKTGKYPEMDNYFKGCRFIVRFEFDKNDGKFSPSYFGYSLDTNSVNINGYQSEAGYVPLANNNYLLTYNIIQEDALLFLFDYDMGICDYYYSYLNNILENYSLSGPGIPDYAILKKKPLGYLLDYNGKYESEYKLFSSEPLKSRLQKTFGNDYTWFTGHCTVQDPIKVNNGIVYIQGCQAHNCPSINYILYIDLNSDRIFAGIFNSPETTIYTESDNRIPLYLVEWKKLGGDN